MGTENQDQEKGFIGGPLGEGGASAMGVPLRGASAGPTETPPAAKVAPDALSVLQHESERKDELIRQLLTRAPAQGDDRAAPALEIRPPGPSPDPIREPEKFRQWADGAQRYNQGLIQQAVLEGRNEITETQVRDRLWSSFQQRYPELAADPSMCRYAFQAELERTGGRLPPDEGKFLDAIGSRLRTFRGSASASAVAGGNAATAGVLGGSGNDAARIVDPATGPVSDATKTGKPFALQLEEIRQKRNPDLFG